MKVRFHAEAAGKNVVTDQVINLAEKNRHYNRAGPTLCMICYLLMVEESNTGVFPEVPNVE